MSLSAGTGLQQIGGDGAPQIKTTPWTFIDQVTVSTSVSFVIFDLTNEYTTYKLIGDQIYGTTSNYPRIRFSINNNEWTSGYGYGATYTNTASAYQVGQNSSWLNLGIQGSDHPKTFEFNFTTSANDKKPVYSWTYGSGTSTYDPILVWGGGQLHLSSPSTQEVTGLTVYVNTGLHNGGSFKLYGLNNHA